MSDDEQQYRFVLEWLGGDGTVYVAPFAPDARPVIRTAADDSLIEVHIPGTGTPQPVAVLPRDRFVILRREALGQGQEDAS